MKRKYVYRNKSLQKEGEPVSRKKRMMHVALRGIAHTSIVMTLLLFAWFFFDSPREKMLERENEYLRGNYEILASKQIEQDKILSALQDRDDNVYRVIFESEPISASVRMAGSGGSGSTKQLEGYTNSDLVIGIKRKLDRINSQIYIQSRSYDEIAGMIKNKKKMLASIPAIQPVANRDLKRLASGFGWRIHPIEKVRKFHGGVDFSVPEGTEVYATGNGTVTFAGSESKMGKYVEIDHGYGYRTRYGHLKSYSVRAGDHVNRGTTIGQAGKTGKWVTASTVHYEVWRRNDDGTYIRTDPMNYFFNDLTDEQYQMAIEIASRGISLD